MQSETLGEIVSRFVGLLLASMEDTRVQSEPQAFEHANETASVEQGLAFATANVRTAHEIKEHAPGVPHREGVAPIEAGRVGHVREPKIEFDAPRKLASVSASKVSDAPAVPAPIVMSDLNILPGHQIALGAVQTNLLSDDDVLLLDGEPIEHVDTGSVAKIEAAAHALRALSDEALLRDGADGMPALDPDGVMALASLEEREGAVELTVLDGQDANGLHIDGVALDEAEAPSLAALRESRDEARERDDAEAAFLAEVDGAEGDETDVDDEGDGSASDESNDPATAEGEWAEQEIAAPKAGAIDAMLGGNTLSNIAAIDNAGVIAAHWVVGGDMRQLDLVVQSNAWTDSDSGFAAGAAIAVPTVAHSLAGLVLAGLDGHSTIAAIETSGTITIDQLPASWNVSVATGDFVSMEWVRQTNAMSDEDVVSTSFSKATTTIVSGENGALNAFDFDHLGSVYDLVMVGGDVHDLNVIFQTNVLIDDDRIEGSAAAGTASDGNILWNEARIENLRAEGTDGLTPALGDALDALARGQDAAIPGNGDPLDVLFVSGNFFDVNVVEQLNVLADSDRLIAHDGASEESGVLHAVTGDNELSNIASIRDVDGFGSVSVGGTHYSDALLVQGELAEGFFEDLSDDAPAALASEVIAFIDTDEAPNEAEAGTAPAVESGSYADVMVIA